MPEQFGDILVKMDGDMYVIKAFLDGDDTIEIFLVEAEAEYVVQTLKLLMSMKLFEGGAR